MSTYNSYEGLDRYFYPVVITQQNNTLEFSEAGTTRTATISPGVYWAHLETNSTIESTYPSLLKEIESKMGAATPSGDSYTVTAQDLSSGDLRYSSLTWTNDNSNNFKFLWSSSTLNPGYLGFKRFQSADQSTAATSQDGTVSVLGQWIAPVKAAYKLRDSSKQAFRSDQGPNASINSWTPPKQMRGFKYHKVHGAHVYRYRAKDNTEATEAGLPTGDTNNALEDMVKSMPDSRILAKHVSSQQSNAMEFNTESPSVSESYIAMSDEVKLTEIRGERTKWEGEHYDIEGGLIIYEDESALDGYQH